MYAKLENKKLIYAPRNYDTGANLILNFNRNIELMKKYNFKEVIDIKPTYDSSTHYLSIENYTENDDTITINYAVNEIEINNEPSLEERVTELERINKEQSRLIKRLLLSANLMELE